MRSVLNDLLLGLYSRLEALEAAKGVQSYDFSFATGGDVSATVAPFAPPGLRMSLPFTPTGLVLLRLFRTQPAGQPVLELTHDVKWHFGAGPSSGDGVLHIDYVTGLEPNSRYDLRIGVTRA